MYKTLGRIVARGKIAGIYIPFSASEQLDGIYEIRECMGDLIIVKIGEPAMKETRFKGIDLECLFDNRDTSAMTTKELKELSYE